MLLKSKTFQKFILLIFSNKRRIKALIFWVNLKPALPDTVVVANRKVHVPVDNRNPILHLIVNHYTDNFPGYSE